MAMAMHLRDIKGDAGNSLTASGGGPACRCRPHGVSKEPEYTDSNGVRDGPDYIRCDKAFNLHVGAIDGA